jgi:Raf kinase inhibitor-like YbhB/YbcL family protein
MRISVQLAVVGLAILVLTISTCYLAAGVSHITHTPCAGLNVVSTRRVLARVGHAERADYFLCTAGEKKMSIQITSSAFAQGHAIPKKYTGEGADVSPPLAWSNLPENTRELALICDDPDAPTDEPWVHWVIYKIPAKATGLPEGVARKTHPPEPAGALQGKNSWPNEADRIGYRGPMPPPGHGVHHYHFKLYALDAPIEAAPGLEKKALLEKIKDHVLAIAEVMGTYER